MTKLRAILLTVVILLGLAAIWEDHSNRVQEETLIDTLTPSLTLANLTIEYEDPEVVIDSATGRLRTVFAVRKSFDSAEVCWPSYDSLQQHRQRGWWDMSRGIVIEWHWDAQWIPVVDSIWALTQGKVGGTLREERWEDAQPFRSSGYLDTGL